MHSELILRINELDNRETMRITNSIGEVCPRVSTSYVGWAMITAFRRELFPVDTTARYPPPASCCIPSLKAVDEKRSFKS